MTNVKLPSTTDNRIDIAKHYAASKGFHVFPCCWPDDQGKCACPGQWDKTSRTYKPHTGKQIGKAPIVANWQKEGARTTAAGIDTYAKKYPGCNWGGWIPNMTGIDVDKDTGGYTSLTKLEQKYGPLPETLTHLTGGGGLHIIYVDKKGRNIGNTVAMAGYPGLDRRGNGGQLLLPGSKHKSGGIYSVRNDLPIAEVPDWLAEIETAERPQFINPNATAEANKPIPIGEQDSYITSRAWALAGKGDTAEAIYQQLKIIAAERFIDQDQSDPWTDESLRDKAQRAFDKYKVKGSGYVDYAYHGDNGLPKIQINNRQLRDITEDSLKALYQSNKPERLFIRNGVLTRINIDEHHRPFTDDVSESSLRGDMARAANYIRINEKGHEVSVSPSIDVVRDLKSLPNHRLDFPGLVNVVESPVIRKDGSILDQPGYDPTSKIIFYPNGSTIPEVAETPNKEQLTKAIELLNELICNFPFDSPASHDTALAMLFTPIINPMIDDPKPGTIVDKPAPGTGASYLCRIVSIIATGHDAPMLSIPDKEEEIKKLITSLMAKGQTLLIIDNVENKLQSASLASVLTAKKWQDRILGQSKTGEWPNNMVVIVNGNNVRLGGDLPRRFLWIRMDAKLAKPWQRDTLMFKHPEIIKWTTENRAQILASILTIVRCWLLAGRPEPVNLTSLGGYETYSHIMGGIMHFIGAKYFMANLDKMYDEVDQDTPQWLGFFEAWNATIDKPVIANELVRIINTNEALKDALPDCIADTDTKNYGRKIGNAIAKKKDTKYENEKYVYELTGKSKYQGSILWEVTKDEKTVKTDSRGYDTPNGESRESSYSQHTENKKDLYTGGVIKDSRDSQPMLNQPCESQKQILQPVSKSGKSDSNSQEVCKPPCNQCPNFQRMNGKIGCLIGKLEANNV